MFIPFPSAKAITKPPRHPSTCNPRSNFFAILANAGISSTTPWGHPGAEPAIAIVFGVIAFLTASKSIANVTGSRGT